MKFFTKGIGVLLIAVFLISCEEEEVDSSPGGQVISGFDYTIVANSDGDGTMVTLTPSGIGATSFEIDWGDGTAVTTISSGEEATHDYANPTTTDIADQTSEYLVVVTASGSDVPETRRPLNLSVTFDLDEDGVFGEDECPRYAAGGSPDGDRTGCPSIPSVAGLVSTRPDSDIISIFSDGVENPDFSTPDNDNFGVGYLAYDFNASEVDFFASPGEDTKFLMDAVSVVIGDLDDGKTLIRDEERDNAVLQYAFLDEVSIAFAAIDLTASNEDVSSLTNLHLQVYSTEVDELLVTLIDSENEETYEFDSQALINGDWATIDITLPAGLVDGSIDEIQIKEGSAATTSGSKTIYVDNVYLYK